MLKYFFIRVVKQKNLYISLLAGLILSVLYIWYDVIPYSDSMYRHSVYDIWIGGFTGSIFAMLLYLIIPLLVAFPMAGFYLEDKKSGYFTFIQARRKTKQYFINLILCNFIVGGIALIFPLLLNIYMCYLFVPDKKLDFIVGETHNVTLYGGQVLFPELYYEHPLLHLILSIFIAFLVGGILATIAIAFSSYAKNIFTVWISAFVINYLYESITGIVCKNGAGKYQLMSYAHQVAPTGSLDLLSLLLVMIPILAVSIISFYIGVKRYELD